MSGIIFLGVAIFLIGAYFILESSRSTGVTDEKNESLSSDEEDREPEYNVEVIQPQEEFDENNKPATTR